MDIDFFASALIFSSLASARYAIGRWRLGREFISRHCTYSALSGVAILTALSCIKFSLTEGTELIESSITTGGCILAGIWTVLTQAKANIKRLINDVP